MPSEKDMQNRIPNEESEVVLTDRNSAAQVPEAPSAQTLKNPGSQLMAAHVAIWEWDLTTNQIYFSPEYRRQLDAGEAESTNGLSVWEAHLHSEDRERVTQGLRLYLANPELCYEAVFRFSAQRQQLSLDDAAGRSDP